MHCARCTILQEALVPCIIVRFVASMINLGSIGYLTVHQVISYFLTVILFKKISGINRLSAYCKGATLIFIFGRGSAISYAKGGK